MTVAEKQLQTFIVANFTTNSIAFSASSTGKCSYRSVCPWLFACDVAVLLLTRVLDLRPIHVALGELLDELVGKLALADAAIARQICIVVVTVSSVLEVQPNRDAREEDLVEGCGSSE